MDKKRFTAGLGSSKKKNGTSFQTLDVIDKSVRRRIGIIWPVINTSKWKGKTQKPRR